MDAVAARPEFTPPPQPGRLSSVVLAVAAHLLLLAALTWGVRWNRDRETFAAEAELWSPTVEQAAPRAVQPPPPPPPPPVPAPAPAPVVQPPPPAPAPQQADAQIALEREKARREQERRREEEEAQRQKKLAEQREQEQRRKQEQAKAAEDRRKQEQAKAAEERRKKDDQAKARERQEQQARLDALRQENIRRAQGLAAATGAPAATGNAYRSAGPSGSYAGKLAALFQNHVLVPGGVETIPGNPVAELQVRVSPSGNILSVRLVRSSGNPTWDEAAVRAIERTARIPPDEDGRFVLDFPVGLSPKPR